MRASYLGDGDGRLRDVLDAARSIAGATRLHVPGCQHLDNRTETDEISNEIRDACVPRKRRLSKIRQWVRNTVSPLWKRW